MKNRYITEHLWRLIRALFILAGTALWLYTDVSAHYIMACYVGAALADQMHGGICYFIEAILDFKHEHDKYE